MHGGTGAVESRLGAGTTFRVVIPDQPRPGPADAVPRVVETSSTIEDMTVSIQQVAKGAED